MSVHLNVSLEQIATRLGGEVCNGRDGPYVAAPGPGHRPKDRSLTVAIDPSAPDGFLVNSFSDKDKGNGTALKDYVRDKAGLPAFVANRRKATVAVPPSAELAAKRAEATARAAERLTKMAAAPTRTVVDTYSYTDEHGELLYEVLRFEPKDFRQRAADGGWSLDGVRRVLFRLPELIADNADVVFICEGEKDVLRLVDLGLCATTISGGTRWTDVIESLRGRDVIIVPDHDTAGAKKAWEAGSALHGTAASVRVVTLPGLSGQPGDKDVSDWLNADPSRADTLVDLCVNAPLWVPQPAPPVEDKADNGVGLEDFYAYLPMHAYIFVPSREMWPAISVNAKIPPVFEDGEAIGASRWLDINRAATQMTWAPGLPLEIQDRIISDGGWIERKGIFCLNLYRSPIIQRGNAAGADRWVEHVHKVFSDDAGHIIAFCAHRVQRPQEKINHALFLGGSPGIGKDSLLAPVKSAVGPWNFQEVSPKTMLGAFNGFAKSVILRVSEARDLGDVNRYMFYDATKIYAAAPPDVLRVNEKHLREHYVANVCGVIITSNYKSDGLFLPPDDRRHYVAWSDLTAADFPNGYWNSLWRWYGSGGEENVAAYLSELDISRFDAKAPPPKTPAFWTIVDANRAPEESELADVLDKLGRPDAVTLGLVLSEADGSFEEWVKDRRNRRAIPHRFERCGYVPVRNEAAADGLWKINRARQVVYARVELSVRDRFAAAAAIVRNK